jgi:hypothetical protein
LGTGSIAGKGFSPVTGVGPQSAPHEKVPAGIPGAQARDTAPPPAGSLDIPPTDALFEAINRGDLSMAKDALNRGADLSGRNVLGMTPLDLSIDLSRNDITFLLLSMRSQAAVSGPPSAAPPPGGKRLAGAKPAKPVREANSTSQTRSASAVTAITAAAASAPVRYASVPTSPVPQAGFLGFGPTPIP